MYIVGVVAKEGRKKRETGSQPSTQGPTKVIEQKKAIYDKKLIRHEKKQI